MQDYSALGVTSMDDRKKLFQLIQTIKNELEAADMSDSIGKLAITPKKLNRAAIMDSPAVDTPTKRNPFAFEVQSPAVNTPVKRFVVEEEKKLNIRSPRRLLNAYGVPINQAQTRSTSLVDLSDKIRVCVRKRPLNKKELRRNEVDIVELQGHKTLMINEPKVKVDLTKYVEQHSFIFDEVFDCDVDNDEVYRRTALPLVEYIFTGGKATCFAYGQTGSGKTFTMLDGHRGLYVLAAQDIFTILKSQENQHLSAWIGFYEIYQGHLYDLLNGRKRLHAREDGKQQVCISGLKEFEVDSVENLMKIFEYGYTVRTTGSTGANADSSRSHGILQIVLKHRSSDKVHGKFSFIDLAGSERGADRGDTDKQTRMEGSEINKSLLALKECIRALDLDSKHTPFRQSKLTQVLKDSFVGNSRTCMIATISPNMTNISVKELRGEVSDSEDADRIHLTRPSEVFNSSASLGPNSKSSKLSLDSDLLIDQEMPPDTLHSNDTPQMRHKSFSTSVKKNSILTSLNVKSSNKRMEETISVMSDFVEVHRSHLKDFMEVCDLESDSLSAFLQSDMLRDDILLYLRSLDEMLCNKEDNINALRSIISDLLPQI